MSDWTDQDSAIYQQIASVAVPRRREMLATIVALVPFEQHESPKIVELASGDGRLGAALLDSFPEATLVAFDGSETMRTDATQRLARFGDRARVRPFDLASLEWWDLLHGADVVVSSLAIHHLNDAKKQYLYKAVSERLSARGAFLMADLVEPAHPSARRVAAEAWDAAAQEQAKSSHPAALFHQLVWLRHAGFAVVDCFWMFAGHAVIGGFKGADGGSGGVPWANAEAAVRRALDA